MSRKRTSTYTHLLTVFVEESLVALVATLFRWVHCLVLIYLVCSGVAALFIGQRKPSTDAASRANGVMTRHYSRGPDPTAQTLCKLRSRITCTDVLDYIKIKSHSPTKLWLSGEI